jgi:uncharacterized protein (TIGR03083 family)
VTSQEGDPELNEETNTMSSRTRTIENLEACYRATEELMDSLSADDWTVQSLCPEWDTRGIVVHLAGIEAMLAGWAPESVDDPLPFDQVARFAEAAADWSTDQLVAETKAVFDTRRADLAAAGDEMFNTPCQTPVGPGTYHRFMDIRTFDFWVHHRDVTTPLGRSTDDGGPAAETTVDEIQGSMGYIVGKKIGLPEGMSISFNLTGPVHRDIHVSVDGRAGLVDSLDDPSVTITADSLTFVQLACGRIDPQGAIDAGRISWSGDAQWGEQAARNLRFTM